MINSLKPYLRKWLPLGVIVILIILGYLRWGQTQRISKEAPQPPTGEPVTSSPEVKQVITTPQAIFFTKAIIPDRRKTYVLIPYKLDNPHQEMWLSLKTDPNTTEVIVLVDHPIFNQLDWPYITNDQLTLFQKQTTYQTIEDFLQNPPKESVITDPHLAYQSQFSQLKTVPLSTDLDLDQYNYLLTTYKPAYQDQGFTMFETIVDASNGTLDKDQQMLWKLDIPKIGPDNKLYLGEVHVDYRQTSI